MKNPALQIQILLIEEDLALGKVLREAISKTPDIALCATTRNRREAVEALADKRIDVAVVDLHDWRCVELIRSIVTEAPACGIMVFADLNNQELFIEALLAGAVGYLLRDSPLYEIVDAIRSLGHGGSPINPLIARQIITQLKYRVRQQSAIDTDSASSAEHILSNREMEVLGLINKGFSSAEIAQLLKISPNTVMTFVRRIFRKLDVTSRIEAVYEARHRGLLLCS